MSTHLLTLAGAVLIWAALVAFQTSSRHAWAARGITPGIGWLPLAGIQLLAVLAATTLIEPAWGAGPALSAAALSWLSVLAMATDLASMKIPWDAFWPPALFGATQFAFQYTPEGALSAGTALVALVLLPLGLRALTRSGLGMSDVRLLATVTLTTAWWIGQTWLIYGLGAAGLIQLAVRAIAGPLNWGRMTPIPGTETASAPTLRRELPFAPALIIGLWACIVAGTLTLNGACSSWNVTGACPTP